MQHGEAFLALPLLDCESNITGYYKFTDDYLNPQVLFTNYPVGTKIIIGGRTITIKKAVSVKIRFLQRKIEPILWHAKKQHRYRINLGEYYPDMADVEVAYSYSVPRTHIYMGGYMIHIEPYCTINFESYSSLIHICPEDVCKDQNIISENNEEELAGNSITNLNKSMFYSVIYEGADLPLYSVAVPKTIESGNGYKIELQPSSIFYNDCENILHIKEEFSVTAQISDISSPSDYPPLKRALHPFENNIFWSYVYNEILKKRLKKDELMDAYNYMQQLYKLSQNPNGYISLSKKYDRMIEKLLDILKSSGKYQQFVNFDANKCCNYNKLKPISGRKLLTSYSTTSSSEHNEKRNDAAKNLFKIYQQNLKNKIKTKEPNEKVLTTNSQLIGNEMNYKYNEGCIDTIIL